LTGGGDVPGLNAAIRGCVMRAMDFGWDVVGISEGWKGLIEGSIQPLGISEVEDLMDKGGTILGTSRVNPYKVEKGVERCLDNMNKLKLDGLIAMGGEDTLGVANKLYKEYKMKIVGVPKTMDNDLSSTDYTFGFDTSVTLAVNALGVLKDTGKSHRRIMVLEVMGRHAGWVALFTAIGGGADWVLLPEEKVDIDAMCEHLKKVYKRKQMATVVVSEGIEIPEKKVGAEKLDQFGHMLLKERGVGETVAKIIQDRLGVDTRASVIGHMQRGGPPTLFDRMLAVRAGVRAVELVKERKFGHMVSLRGTEMEAISLDEAVGKLKAVSREWIELAHKLFK